MLPLRIENDVPIFNRLQNRFTLYSVSLSFVLLYDSFKCLSKVNICRKQLLVQIKVTVTHIHFTQNTPYLEREEKSSMGWNARKDTKIEGTVVFSLLIPRR